MILNALFFFHALVQSPQLDPGKSIGHVLDRLWPSAPEAIQAHPIDGWRMRSNDEAGVVIRQTRTAEERDGAARQYCSSNDLTIPVLVDSLDNHTAEA